LSPFLNSKK